MFCDLELGQPLLQLGLDAFDRLREPHLVGDVVRRGEQRHGVELFDELARERIDNRDALDLVAEELDPDRLFFVGREHLDRVAAHAELVAHESEVVPLVLQLDQAAQDVALVARLAHAQHQQLLGVLLGRTETVDGRHRRNDDHVAPGEQCARGRVAQPVDLVVDRAVFLDVRVGRGEVRLGLVVVVVADEVLDAVLREHLPELGRELRGQRLVGREHERGPARLRDHVRDREALARTRDAEQRLEAIAVLDPFDQGFDRLGLIARRLEIGDELELGHEVERTGRV